MHKIEVDFDINMVLKEIYLVVENRLILNNIELIYEIEKSVPKVLKGDNEGIKILLIEFLKFIIAQKDRKEIIMSVSAPKDFLVAEDITFSISYSSRIEDEKIRFFKDNLLTILQKVNASFIIDYGKSMRIKIPLSISELGKRRHYRLPEETMLNKKMLIITSSNAMNQSCSQMFQYFRYDVDIITDVLPTKVAELLGYDMIIVDEKLVTEAFAYMVSEVKEKNRMHYVVVSNKKESFFMASSTLVKPVTQNDIFNLILKLFTSDYENTLSSTLIKKPIQHALVTENKSFNIDITEHKVSEIKLHLIKILDKPRGRVNASHEGLDYPIELKKFLNQFEYSDEYFKSLVFKNEIGRMKELFLDLEKKACIIGAQSLLKLIDIISIIILYDKVEMLANYPDKFHVELEKLMKEIREYLKV